MKNTNILIISFLISLATIFCYAKENTKTLLIFGANWCKYCVMAKNDMNNDKELSEIVKNYEIINVDFDKDKDLIEGYEIKSIPTFIIFQDGKEVGRYNGYRGPRDLSKFLK